jgi:hypothetical protein
MPSGRSGRGWGGAPHKPRHFTDDFVEVEQHELEIALLEQDTGSADHVSGSPVVRDDVVHDLAYLLEMHDIGRAKTLARLRVAEEDRGQGLTQLVWRAVPATLAGPRN